MKDYKKTLLALVAVAFTIGYLWQADPAVITRQATWDDVQAEAVAGGYRIITTDELAARYGKDPNGLLLIDTRQEWEYRTGHMAGALNFSMEPTWWERWRKAGELAAFLGPDKDRVLVFY